MAQQQQKTDTSNWSRKVANLKAIERDTLPKILDWGHDQVKDKIDAYLSGPHYNEGERGPCTGQIPIPRVSGRLAASVAKPIRISPYLIKFFSDGKIAPYNFFVHDGTKKMKARRFIKDPVDERRPAVENKWRYEIIKETRKRGK